MNTLLKLALAHERLADAADARGDNETARHNNHLAAIYRDRARVLHGMGEAA